MEGRDEIDMDNNETKYCVSWVNKERGINCYTQYCGVMEQPLYTM